MLYVNTNFAIDHFVLKITWITVLRKYFVACEVRVNLNYSTEVRFTLFYWFKSRTWQSNSNRACAKGTRGSLGNKKTWRLILRRAPVCVEIAVIFKVN